jgi:N-acetylmuramoyl-L-alanine amidase
VRRFGLLTVWILFSALLFGSVAVLEKAEIKKGELRLHFDKRYNKSKIKRFTLRNPYRVIFDIPDARLKNGRVGKGLETNRCEDIRISQYKRNVVRVVIETSKRHVCKAYRPSYAYRSYHIVLPPFKATKKRSVRKSTPAKRTRTAKKHKTASKKRTTTQKRTYLTKHNPYKRGHGELIVIDPGHGGHDTGAIAGGKREKDLVLQISRRVAKELRRRGYKVILTRNGDKFLKLSQRTRIADRKDAKVFVSIHANSVPRRKRNKVYGIETYFLQKTRDAKSQRIAARENAAVLKGTGKLSKKILIDSVLNGPKIIESNKLAIDVQRHIITELRKHYKYIKDGGVRPAPFYVLVGASRPSILIEVGYISHPMERKRLFNPTYQKRMAKAIADGIQSYLNHRKQELGF